MNLSYNYSNTSLIGNAAPLQKLSNNKFKNATKHIKNFSKSDNKCIEREREIETEEEKEEENNLVYIKSDTKCIEKEIEETNLVYRDIISNVPLSKYNKTVFDISLIIKTELGLDDKLSYKDIIKEANIQLGLNQVNIPLRQALINILDIIS